MPAWQRWSYQREVNGESLGWLKDENICHMRKSWESRLLDLEMWKFREDFSSVYKNMKRDYKEGARLFSVVSTDHIRGNRHKVKYGRIPLNVRNYFQYLLTVVRMTEYLLPREMVKSPFLQIFKSHLYMVLSYWIKLTCLFPMSTILLLCGSLISVEDLTHWIKKWAKIPLWNVNTDIYPIK